MLEKNANKVMLWILIGVISGGICGWYFGPQMKSLAWIGHLFLNALKMLIVPLIMASMISGMASLGDVRKLGRVGGITMAGFMLTTAIAVMLGLILVNWIAPGAGIEHSQLTIPAKVANRSETGISDIFLAMVSPNLVQSATNNDLLPLIVFSLLFAAALTTIGKTGQIVFDLANGTNEAMMRLVAWVIYFAPVGIFSLVAARLGNAGGGEAFIKEVTSVGWYVLTIISGLVIHFALLLALFMGMGRKTWHHFKGVLRALLTAFGTASSAATLPVTLECARDIGIDERAIRFTIPLGCTINMNGTALYEAVAALFIAQAWGIDLSFSQQIIVFLTATLAAIGAAAIPEAGLVTMVLVLQAVGLPLEGIGLLLAVDWFLDRFRTTINVWGDVVIATILTQWLKKHTEMDVQQIK